MKKPVLLSGHPELLVSLLENEREIALVHDRNVSHFAERISGLVPRGSVKACIAVDAREKDKTLESAADICRRLLDEGVSREGLLIGIGGGVTTDLAGFAAAIYKRGIRFAAVPTTLLGQVDAAIGGKNGVNLDGYKNAIGTFCFPEFTLLCPEAREGLPERELRCGLAEMLKTFLIADAPAYHRAVRNGWDQSLVEKAAGIKASIVAEDPFDNGHRKVLNLGHSFGHAIEKCSGGNIPHGEAVSMGIIMAARLSEAAGVTALPLAKTLAADFSSAGLPTDCPFAPGELAPCMKADKKRSGDTLDFVLLEAPGKPVLLPLSIEKALELL